MEFTFPLGQRIDFNGHDETTGMTRSLDSLGRIVIPIEMRMSMGIDACDPLEFYMDIETGFLSMGKYIGVACKLCNAVEDLTYFRNSLIYKDIQKKESKPIITRISRTPKRNGA
ncbi:AbrB/MazE/SpoVT family DNA-binding domain-containing protein [Paenibacillus polymyxa]|uniref:AbrB/MazE/SpoVT family DNA-binding domain-containing protein n=1 Tax=Paenibacillus polymyxa TaxID=1406 RepID=UPI0001E321AD|nr:hypothetical protein [Paenibacillus polymyxa]